MKFVIKNALKENIVTLMRRVGYYFIGENKTGRELIFVRPLRTGRSGYPRFHIYLKVNQKTEEILFNLHLDQKKPIYRGVTAHSGEYDGKIVKEETERIKQILSK